MPFASDPIRRTRDIAADVLGAVAPFDTAPTPRPHVAQVYVQLGSMQYEVSGPVFGMESQRKATYAQHDVIDGKPRLQAIGDDLEQLTLTLELHSGYCDPVLELASLKSAQAAHVALPLIFAAGELRGRYVISELHETHNQHHASGVPIHVSVRAILREWVEDQSVELASRRKRAAAAVNPAQQATATKAAKPFAFGVPSAVPTSAITRQHGSTGSW